MTPYPRQVDPLWYPIKPEAKVRLAAQSRLRPRHTRPVDVGFFFGRYANFDEKAGERNTSCRTSSRSWPGRATADGASTSPFPSVMAA
eukprot:4147885-Prymnesium_polylepis.1